MSTEQDDYFDEFMADPYQEAFSPFGTPEEKKQRNKEANMAACGNNAYSKGDGEKKSHSLKPDGSRDIIVVRCKYYRECDNCRYVKFIDEVEPRLNHAQNHLNLGDRPRFDTITEDERGAYMKRLSRGEFEYYCFPQPGDELIVIHNNPDGAGDELWEFGYDDIDLYNENNGLDLNFYTILKNVPEGKKVSGHLGRKTEDEEEEGNGPGEEEVETYSIKKPYLFKEGLSERDAQFAYVQAVINTQNISVTNEIELEQAMFNRINVMAEQINDSIVGFTWTAVTADEIESWNSNPNNFSKNDKNVQISTIHDTHSRNLDKNHKKSSFEAVKEKVNRGDDLDSERQKALEDYLRYHGT